MYQFLTSLENKKLQKLNNAIEKIDSYYIELAAKRYVYEKEKENIIKSFENKIKNIDSELERMFQKQNNLKEQRDGLIKLNKEREQLTQEYVYLNVPFNEKEEAKQLGAKWDGIHKKWYITADMELLSFQKWIP